MVVTVLDFTTAFRRTEREGSRLCVSHIFQQRPLSFGLIGSPGLWEYHSVGWLKPGWPETIMIARCTGSFWLVYTSQGHSMCLGVGPILSTWLLPSGGRAGSMSERQSHCSLDPAVPLVGYLLSNSPCSLTPPTVWHLAHFSHASQVLDSELN